MSIGTVWTYEGHFEHSAFIWDSIFSQRRDQVYDKEDKAAVQEGLDASISLTSQEIISRFLYYKCGGDEGRYLYRSVQISDFLKDVDFECLRHASTSDVLCPLVLIDDRNNWRVPEGNVAGNFRSSRKPMNAHQFYHELCKAVCWVRSPLLAGFTNHVIFSDSATQTLKSRMQKDA